MCLPSSVYCIVSQSHETVRLKCKLHSDSVRGIFKHTLLHSVGLLVLKQDLIHINLQLCLCVCLIQTFTYFPKVKSCLQTVNLTLCICTRQIAALLTFYMTHLSEVPSEFNLCVVCWGTSSWNNSSCRKYAWGKKLRVVMSFTFQLCVITKCHKYAIHTAC